jgi:hypothetical protein
MLSPELRRLDDHAIARQRRMYARLLFVVVSILGRFFLIFAPLTRDPVVPGGLAWQDAADIRFAHE